MKKILKTKVKWKKKEIMKNWRGEAGGRGRWEKELKFYNEKNDGEFF